MRIIPSLVSLLLPLSAMASDALADGFHSPPSEAKAQTWWHWMNGNISKEGITADLESMARVGLGGVQVFNVSEGIPEGAAPYFSPQWFDLMRHAVSEAGRLGLEVCFHNCAGWSSSGGPWITPEYAMQVMVSAEVQVAGGSRYSEVLPKGAVRRDYYKDIAVLAFPTPEKNIRIENIGVKSLSDYKYKYEHKSGLMPNPVDIQAGGAIDQDKIVDISDKMDGTGRLSWDVPKGNWTILRVGHTCTGAVNSPSPMAGRGLECDKLSREAMDVHWRGGIQPILDKLGPLAGKVMNNLLIDSYEVGTTNWTPRMRDEFQRRRGYDMMKWMPIITGRIVASSEMSERFLWDLRRTVGELFAENYYDYFSELCHKHGLTSSVEPYDGPFENLRIAKDANMVMGEFWVHGDITGYNAVRLAASTAHTHGQKIVGAESFTSGVKEGRWLGHPGQLKALGDLMWSEGVNRFILHTFTHQPWLHQDPGITMGQWGSHFGRTNTWWEQSREWFSYAARSQYMLQSGQSRADVLFFAGESSPNGTPLRRDLKAKGWDYDAIGTDLIQQLTVRDGLLVTPAGTSYRLLVLPNSPWMTPAVAKKVQALVESGAAVLGGRPKHSPSLSGYPKCDDEVGLISDVLWPEGRGERRHGRGVVLSGMEVDEALGRLAIEPDCRISDGNTAPPFIHRRIDDAEVWLVTNPKSEMVRQDVSFRISGYVPELWNAETGAIVDAPRWRRIHDRTEVALSFEPSGSIFVVFRRPTKESSSMVWSVVAPPPQEKPHRPSLEIQSAFYGAYVHPGPDMLDVTEIVRHAVRDGKLRVTANNDLAWEPCPGKSKRLAVTYDLDGVRHQDMVDEHEVMVLPTGGKTGKLEIVRAAYGHIPDNFPIMHPTAFADVTKALSGHIKDGILDVRIDGGLVERDPAPKWDKKLIVNYTVDGVPSGMEVRDQTTLHLPDGVEGLRVPETQLIGTRQGAALRIWEPSTPSIAGVDGVAHPVVVTDFPKPMKVTGSWAVSFQEGRGAPEQVTLPELRSLSDHADPGVRYFSGHAVYRRQIDIPASYLRNDLEVYVDLGRVAVIAEVSVNGRDMGTLWKPPYRLNIAPALKAGLNDLAIQVTTLWPNRMIGDELLPEDVEWKGLQLKSWPVWLTDEKSRRPTPRLTFSTWHHWRQNMPLVESGLLGPVVVRPAVVVPVKMP